MNFDTPILIMTHLAAFAFFISLALSGFMIFAGLMDTPGPRSNHAHAVPTAGGVGIVAGLGMGMLALAMFYPAYGEQGLFGSLMALSLGMALLGLLDDMYEMNSRLKFFTITVLAGASVHVIGPPQAFPMVIGELPIPYWLGFAGAVLWVFVVTNGVNFMDGANGLVSVSMAIAFLALAIIAMLVGASAAALLSVVMMAALLGFLPYNIGNRVHIFSGDVGALLVGFCFANASLLLVFEAPAFGLLYVGPLLFLPFLADILLTMLLRALRRENLFAPHSTHLYQRLIRSGKSHMFICALYGLATLLMACVTIAGLLYGMTRSLTFLLVWVSVFSLVYLIIHKKLS